MANNNSNKENPRSIIDLIQESKTRLDKFVQQNIIVMKSEKDGKHYLMFGIDNPNLDTLQLFCWDETSKCWNPEWYGYCPEDVRDRFNQILEEG